MARPKKEIDPKQVEELAAIQCSYAEMAAVLRCDPKTLSNRFGQEIRNGRERGKSSLKRKQYELAMSGNCTMLIWLGKQHLEQSDKNEQRLDGKLETESRNGQDHVADFKKLINALINERKG